MVALRGTRGSRMCFPELPSLELLPKSGSDVFFGNHGLGICVG